jgi:hypothetical protein
MKPKAYIDEHKGSTADFIIDYYKYINIYEIWDIDQECVVPHKELKTEAAAIEYCEKRDWTWRLGLLCDAR